MRKISVPFSQITLNKYELSVHLGWGEAERSRKQMTHITLKLRFPEPPEACISDNITGTHCYGTLLANIKMHCENKSYKLLEHYAFDIYNHLKLHIAQATQLWVQVTKINPPIAHLTGGATFQFGDWIES